MPTSSVGEKSDYTNNRIYTHNSQFSPNAGQLLSVEPITHFALL
jgi:hypothetical protein